MCGIAGFWNPRDQRSQEALLEMAERMAGSLSHRGPDSSGTWADAGHGIAFAHARLAILDLSSAGHQPMTSQNGKCVLTYNGEIYNFCEMRDQLATQGVQFSGHSDTEVLVEAFARWGIQQTIPMLNGMFAFAVWLTETRQLVIGRDRMGQKPLYYGWNESTFYFASELRALKQHPDFSPVIDPSVLAAYFRYSCVPSPFSIYQGISKLGPGEYAVFSQSGQDPVIQSYWSLAEVACAGERNSLRLSPAEAAEQLDQYLRRSIQRRLIADVPVGAFLSGGIDSSTVVACMQELVPQKVVSFTIGYEEEPFNEAPYAKAVATHLGTEHHELYVTAQDALDLIPEVVTTYDEPFADISQIPTMLVSRLARSHVKVCLSGDGGDELFCGYDRYQSALDRWQKLNRSPAIFRKFAGGVIGLGSRLLTGNDWLRRTSQSLRLQDAVELFAFRRQRVYDSELLVPQAKSVKDVYTDRTLWADLKDPLNQMMFLDLAGWLVDDILVKVDRASMGTSLEVRNPLLDHELVEFSWRVPLEYKLRDGKRKWLLRKVLDRYVPEHLIDRPKRGFAVPVGDWLRGPLRDWAESLLDEKRIIDQGLLSPTLVRAYWQEFLKGSNRYRMIVWSLLMVQAWLDQD